MGIFLLSALFQVVDISGQGYTDVIYETRNVKQAYVVASEFNKCDVFKEQGEKFYRVICQSTEYITDGNKTYKKVN